MITIITTMMIVIKSKTFIMTHSYGINYAT